MIIRYQQAAPVASRLASGSACLGVCLPRGLLASGSACLGIPLEPPHRKATGHAYARSAFLFRHHVGTKRRALRLTFVSCLRGDRAHHPSRTDALSWAVTTKALRKLRAIVVLSKKGHAPRVYTSKVDGIVATENIASSLRSDSNLNTFHWKLSSNER